MKQALRFIGAPFAVIGFLYYVLIEVPFNDGRNIGYRKVVDWMYGKKDS